MFRTAGALIAAALISGAASAQQLAEIDKPASELKQILTDRTDLPGGSQEVRVVTALIEPRTAAAWHTHPTPVYVYVQEGTVSMEIEGQEPRQLQSGVAVAEPLDARMRVVNHGDQPARLVVFQISPPQKAFLEEEKKGQAD